MFGHVLSIRLRKLCKRTYVYVGNLHKAGYARPNFENTQFAALFYNRPLGKQTRPGANEVDLAFQQINGLRQLIQLPFAQKQTDSKNGILIHFVRPRVLGSYFHGTQLVVLEGFAIPADAILREKSLTSG